jgi:hypothetical protein
MHLLLLSCSIFAVFIIVLMKNGNKDVDKSGF